MARILKAIITAKTDLDYLQSLEIRAEIDCPEEKVDEWRDRIEAKLTSFVASASMESGIEYRTEGVIWRERGNRNQLNRPELWCRRPCSNCIPPCVCPKKPGHSDACSWNCDTSMQGRERRGN